MSHEGYHAAIDIGGTKIYSLVLDPDDKIVGVGRCKTKPEKGFEGVMQRVGDCVADACAHADISLSDLTLAGVGAPSPITEAGVAVNAPNMGWDNVPLVKAVSDMLGCPVYAENDCNAGTYGVYTRGVGKGCSNLVGMFVGTGLGGGIIIDGQIVCGSNNMAAEVGHMTVVAGGRPCGCGKRGCLEAYASKTGMGYRIKHDIILEKKPSVLTELCSGNYGNIKSSILKKAWDSKDEVTVTALEEVAYYLGIGIGNIITLLGPQMVVIGGGVFEALGTKLLNAVKKAAEANTHPRQSFKDTKIVLAKLGDEAVALGALEYARSRYKEKSDKTTQVSM